jgi:hypothetical protein
MKTQNEQWMAIAECDGIYHISDQGRAKSYKCSKERILKPILSGSLSSKYFAIGIWVNGKLKMQNIHRLVALAFLPNPDNKPQVNHKDGNKLNNQVGNLEWSTASENTQHAWDNGLNESNRLATIIANSKPVIDITNGKKYDSLKLACEDIGEPYERHKLRHSKSSKLQRFFYID